MPSEHPSVYLILGAAGSGRRELLADLIQEGFDASDRPAVLLSEAEPPAAADTKLGAFERWRWTPERTIDAPLPPGATHVFLVADGRRNPVDQVEAFQAWLSTQSAELARILCVVDCRLAEKHAPLRAWYEACIHFADVVLLNHREGVGNKWLSDFLGHFRSQFYPCLFETVKSGHVGNPALVLDPLARRLTHIFDEDPDALPAGVEIEESDEEEDELEGEEDLETSDEDPYLARRSDGGRRVKEIPDIAKFL